MAGTRVGIQLPRVLVSGLVLDQTHSGAARHNAELLPRAARLLTAGGGGLAVLEGAAGIPLDLGPDVERIPSSAAGHPAWRRSIDEAPALRQALMHARDTGKPFDLVHTAHLPVPARLPVPLTWLIHDLRRADLGSPLARRVGARLIRTAAKRAAAVFSVSAFTSDRLEALAGVRATLVPNGSEHTQPLRRDPALDAPLLYVGHLDPRKDLETLLRALQADPGLPDLWLAGQANGEEAKRLSELAAELGIANRVQQMDPPEDRRLAELFAVCAAVVLPSKYEGFGLVALEALRAGCPLACSDLPPHREVAGAHAAYFPVGNGVACAAAIRTALATSLRANWAAENHARSFSWERSAEVLVEAWARLTPGSVTDQGSNP